MPDVAFTIEQDDPKTFAMEAAASALLGLAREITVSAVTPEIRERLTREESEEDFINRNTVHIALMAVMNAAGEAPTVGSPMIMEALGTAVGTVIAAQAGGALLFSTFWATLTSTLCDNGIHVAPIPASMSDVIPGEEPLSDAEDEDEEATQ